MIKHLLGETSEEESAQVHAWLDAGSQNQEHFKHLKIIWEESRKLALELPVDEERAWQQFRQRMNGQKEKPASFFSLNSAWLRVAAILLLVAGLGLASYWFIRYQQVRQIAFVAGSAVLKDTLPDGSVVTLNKESRITYPSRFKGNKRKVQLEGEAFFNVTPNKSKPFTIQVKEVTIEVVGTSFNVRNAGTRTEIIVETGIVQVNAYGKSAELRPGEKLVTDSQDSLLDKHAEPDRLYNYYRTHEFVCDNTPLWKLVQVLNEAYNANIVIENESLNNLPLTTTFNNESLDHVLQVISQTFDITVQKSGDKIILR